ncbi:MAG: hypothetical protein R2715_04430 [Ilumatobacteraceae bacterium]
MPLLPSTKVDRAMLPAPSGPRHSSTRAGDLVAAANDTERRLAGSWPTCSRAPELSVTAHFIEELGANSLTLAHYVTALRDELEGAGHDAHAVRRSGRALPRRGSQPDTGPTGSLPTDLVRATGNGRTSQPARHGPDRGRAFTFWVLFLPARSPPPPRGAVRWIDGATDVGVAYLRAVAAGGLTFGAGTLGLILVRWLAVGRMGPVAVPRLQPPVLPVLVGPNGRCGQPGEPPRRHAGIPPVPPSDRDAARPQRGLPEPAARLPGSGAGRARRRRARAL